MFDLNPLDVLQQRKIRTIAPHFVHTYLSDAEIFEGAEQWITNKLKGRYYICKKPVFDKDSNLKSAYVVGFEDQKELTYFMLACPYLRRT
jgi:hypothetical protein